MGDERQLLSLIHSQSNSSESNSNRPGKAERRYDENLLDAYSQAVIHVVDSVGPAVISIDGLKTSDTPGSGSGFLLSPDGFALTNSHVVNGRSKLSATTHEGDRLDATLIGDDPETDLALLQVHARDLPFSELGESETLRVGQLVIAMGNPFGFQSTVSTGVVSAVGRGMRSQAGRLIQDVVQHTAPLNPGNSGGPLLDSHGRVVAINTAIIPLAQGLGFAVPASTGRWVIEEIIAHGKVRRPFLGVTVRSVSLNKQLIRELDLICERGIEVVDVSEESPAELAGLQSDDVIVSVNGRLVASADDLHRLMANNTQQQMMLLNAIRNDQLLELEVAPTAR